MSAEDTPLDSFEEDDPADHPVVGDQLVLDLEGFEGPIDLLLQLARDQKVDITKISILALAEQYLVFVHHARRVRLELAADYLVMAAWLAYLKSRLLLPEPEGEAEPSGAEMAAALKFKLQRLEAMQEAGRKLMAGPQLGTDVFTRGMPESLERVNRVTWEVSLYELLSAYGKARRDRGEQSLRILALDLHSVEDAVERLARLLGQGMPGWRRLQAFLPPELQAAISPLRRRSALASTFVASLQLAKSGQVEIRQDGTYGSIFLRPGRGESDMPGDDRGGEDEHAGGKSGA
ncbi:segregation and condensation protein A [Algihabitans albus]|uniref:segregation and condensation protein A n=1 Tax=Algihabitans albus TaxID=2164067 RepID=UPI001F411D20|nr:ScpA family protein [Algihabitans albus]